MIEKFTKAEAIEYCKKHDVNLLLSDINWLEENAVFRIFLVEDDLMMHYLEDSAEDPDTNFITPFDLEIRGLDVVYLDTSERKTVSGEYQNLI